MKYQSITEAQISSIDLEKELEIALFEEATALVAAGAAFAPPSRMEDIKTGARFIIDIVLPEGVASGDNRTFVEDSVDLLQLPLTLLWQPFTGKGHDGSVIVGRIDSIERVDDVVDPSTGAKLKGWGRARGVFDTGVYAQEAERLVRHGFLRSISADLDKFEASTENEESKLELQDENDIKNEKITVKKSRLTAVTLVAKPAFQEPRIYIEDLPDLEAIEVPYPLEDGVYEEEYEDEYSMVNALIAAGVPVAPPKEWTEDPKLEHLSPIIVEDDGRVYGHIASWNMNHIGMPRAQKPPRSRSNYAYFRTGILRTAEGIDVHVGQLTLTGGHSPLNASAEEAVRHYDDTHSAVADVSCGEDRYGIWVAGSLRPGITPEQLRVFRASNPSGDWRPINGKLELVAVCMVNVPGFPVTRALVSGGHVMALVAAGAAPVAELNPKTILEQRIASLEQIVLSREIEQPVDILEQFEKEYEESLVASARGSMSVLTSFMEEVEQEKVRKYEENINKLLDL